MSITLVRVAALSLAAVGVSALGLLACVVLGWWGAVNVFGSVLIAGLVVGFAFALFAIAALAFEA
jgi:hypothetical protein